MRCQSCQYDLARLPENRCPECGRAFDPDDPKTWLGQGRPSIKVWEFVGGVLMTVLLLMLLTMYVFIYHEAGPSAALRFAILTSPGTIVIAAALAYVLRHRSA